MKVKLTRESSLLVITALMILIAFFYYGNLYFLTPIREESKDLLSNVEVQQSLIEKYPPTQKHLEESEISYLETESFLPLGAQANESIVELERLANQSNVVLESVTRIVDQEPITDIQGDFAKNSYTAEMNAKSPEDMRELIKQLMNEERVWNISSFSYSKSGEESYSGMFNFDLFYRIKNKN